MTNSTVDSPATNNSPCRNIIRDEVDDLKLTKIVCDMNLIKNIENFTILKESSPKSLFKETEAIQTLRNRKDLYVFRTVILEKTFETNQREVIRKKIVRFDKQKVNGRSLKNFKDTEIKLRETIEPIQKPQADEMKRVVECLGRVGQPLKKIDSRTSFFFDKYHFLVKKNFTFGYMNVAKEHIHIFQVGRTPLKIYIPKTPNLAMEEGEFDPIYKNCFDIKILQNRSSYYIKPESKYILIAFDRSYFTLHTIEKTLLNDIVEKFKENETLIQDIDEIHKESITPVTPILSDKWPPMTPRIDCDERPQKRKKTMNFECTSTTPNFEIDCREFTVENQMYASSNMIFKTTVSNQNFAQSSLQNIIYPSDFHQILGINSPSHSQLYPVQNFPSSYASPSYFCSMPKSPYHPANLLNLHDPSTVTGFSHFPQENITCAETDISTNLTHEKMGVSNNPIYENTAASKSPIYEDIQVSDSPIFTETATLDTTTREKTDTLNTPTQEEINNSYNPTCGVTGALYTPDVSSGYSSTSNKTQVYNIINTIETKLEEIDNSSVFIKKQLSELKKILNKPLPTLYEDISP